MPVRTLYMCRLEASLIQIHLLSRVNWNSYCTCIGDFIWNAHNSLHKCDPRKMRHIPNDYSESTTYWLAEVEHNDGCAKLWNEPPCNDAASWTSSLKSPDGRLVLLSLCVLVQCMSTRCSIMILKRKLMVFAFILGPFFRKFGRMSSSRC